MPSTIIVLRRVLLTLVAALTLLLVQTASAPATANATVLWPSQTVSSKHVGWVKVKPRAAHDICGFAPPCGVPAYQWTGRAWKSTKVSWSTDVYAYPYASGWHWVWTQRTGWLAMQTSYLRYASDHRCNGLYRC